MNRIILNWLDQILLNILSMISLASFLQRGDVSHNYDIKINIKNKISVRSKISGSNIHKRQRLTLNKM